MSNMEKHDFVKVIYSSNKYKRTYIVKIDGEYCGGSLKGTIIWRKIINLYNNKEIIDKSDYFTKVGKHIDGWGTNSSKMEIYKNKTINEISKEIFLEDL